MWKKLELFFVLLPLALLKHHSDSYSSKAHNPTVLKEVTEIKENIQSTATGTANEDVNKQSAGEVQEAASPLHMMLSVEVESQKILITHTERRKLSLQAEMSLSCTESWTFCRGLV